MTDREAIELSVRQSLCGQLSEHRESIEKQGDRVVSIARIAGIVFSSIALVSGGIFVYLFGDSMASARKLIPELVRGEVSELAVLGQAKTALENNLETLRIDLEETTRAALQSKLEAHERELTSQASARLTSAIQKQAEDAIDGIFRKNVDDAIQNAVSSLQSLTDAQKASLVLQAVPVGTLVAFGGNSLDEKSGWFICNGRTLDRAAYVELFDAIGTSWGAGDGKQTFSLPDLRGLFLRGVDTDSKRDPDASSRTSLADGGNAGAQVGSYQDDTFLAHSHEYWDEVNSAEMSDDANDRKVGSDDTKKLKKDTTKVGGRETRPKNAGVYYIIKYR